MLCIRRWHALRFSDRRQQHRLQRAADAPSHYRQSDPRAAHALPDYVGDFTHLSIVSLLDDDDTLACGIWL